MDGIAQASDIAHVITLSVAPVFLLTGIGATLSVLSFRLGRVVDRARHLEERLTSADQRLRTSIQQELPILARRARLVNRAILLCTTCALLVCGVIVTLFVGAFLNLQVATMIAALFVAAMVALISSLLTFLQEVRLAITNMSIGKQ